MVLRNYVLCSSLTQRVRVTWPESQSQKVTEIWTQENLTLEPGLLTTVLSCLLEAFKVIPFYQEDCLKSLVHSKISINLVNIYFLPVEMKRLHKSYLIGESIHLWLQGRQCLVLAVVSSKGCSSERRKGLLPSYYTQVTMLTPTRSHQPLPSYLPGLWGN